MMELEEQRRREMVERQKDDMIRQIATATCQSAHMLRAISRKAYNAPPASLTDDIRDDTDVCAQTVVDDDGGCENILYRNSTGIMQDHVAQIGTDSALATQMATMRLQLSPPHSRDSQHTRHYHHRKHLEKSHHGHRNIPPSHLPVLKAPNIRPM